MLWCMAPLPELITANAVAKMFATSPDTVRRWVRDGRIDAITLPSGQLRFRREDVEAIIAGGTPEPTAVSA